MDERIVNLLTSLVNVNTTISNAKEIGAANVLALFFRRHNLPYKLYESIPGRTSIICKIEGRQKDAILIHTHLDTENYNTSAGESSAIAVERNERIYGRGTLDCKGNIAVWAVVLADFIRLNKPGKTLIFAATAGEETGGELGTKWLIDHTDVFDRVTFVLGEGGGIPVSSCQKQFFTVQTEEMGFLKDDISNSMLLPKERNAVYQRAVEAGLYDKNTLEYISELPLNLNKRMIPETCFYHGLSELLEKKQFIPSSSMNYKKKILKEALQSVCSNWDLISYISPGYSDNRYFRGLGIETLGFFPLHPDNKINGIHGKNEYISFQSLEVAYRCLSYLLKVLLE